MKFNIPLYSLAFFLLAGGLFMPSGVSAQGGKEPAFSDKENLSYIVSYTAKIMPTVDAGTVTLKTSRTTVGSSPAYNIYANGKVLSSFKWFFDLDDTYQTWLDASTLVPLKHTYRLREGKHRVNCEYAYDWKNMKVTTTYHNLKKPAPKVRTMQLSRGSYDPVALFYSMRCENLGAMSVGQQNTLKIVLDDTIRTVTYKFLGREQRKAGKLGTFNTLKFSCTIASSKGESFEDGTIFYLWITDDRNKIPVYLESPVKVGKVKATLTKFENLKYPLTSKVK